MFNKESRWKLLAVKALRAIRLVSAKRAGDMLDYIVIESSPLFSREWYLQKNPDVAKAHVDPVWHYLHRGWKRDWDPGPEFCGRAYLRRYPDAAEAGIAPLLHFERCGRLEGRALPTSSRNRVNEVYVTRKPIKIVEDLPFSDDLVGRIHQDVLKGLYGGKAKR
ncbi:MAG: hypothetical protein IKE55_10160 [Kiritimatiellae bacterium]|nr:hypothetical protein [Kiritimatiellia bacterium]